MLQPKVYVIGNIVFGMAGITNVVVGHILSFSSKDKKKTQHNKSLL